MSLVRKEKEIEENFKLKALQEVQVCKDEILYILVDVYIYYTILGVARLDGWNDLNSFRVVSVVLYFRHIFRKFRYTGIHFYKVISRFIVALP